jgi:hypothetical protein
MVTHIQQEAEYRAWRNEVFEALYDAGLETVADNWLNCSQNFATFEVTTKTDKLPESSRGVYVCSNDPSHYAKVCAFTCHNRACPDCARRETARLFQRYMPTVQSLSDKLSMRNKFRHIILTTDIDLSDPGCKIRLNELSTMPVKVMDSLLASDWRSRQGFIQTAEFGGDGHKLHFHLFFFGHYIEQQKLSEAWEKITGCPVVYIRVIESADYQHELIEMVKYVTKFWKREPDGTVVYFNPDLVPVLLKVLSGQRRVRSYGVFYGIKDTPHETCCPHCLAPLTRWSPIEWEIYAQTGWQPHEQETELNLKHGNKSVWANVPRNDKPPPEVPKRRLLL